MSYSHHSALALLSLVTSAIAGGYEESVRAAYADHLKQGAEIKHQIRYLSLVGMQQKERIKFLKVLTFHVNSLSKEYDIERPVLVAPDVLRINFLDYGWSREVWEKLADNDPYYHVKLTDVKNVVAPLQEVVEVPQVEKVLVERGRVLREINSSDLREGEEAWVRAGGNTLRRWEGKRKQVKKQEAKQEEKKSVVAHAPWLGKDITAFALSTNSDVPIVRADWFIFWTGIQVNRKGAGYYDFLGFKKREDLQKAVALDIEAAKRVRREMAAIVAESGVALNNRQIIRYQTLTGPYWFTLDVENNEDDRNALEVLNGDFVHAAEEIYATLPNGLFAFGASDANGTLQESVPDKFASDHASTNNDRRIHPGLSCIRCHEEGLRPISDWARETFTGPVKLASPDYQKLKRLQRLYLSDLPSQLKLDQEGYARVIKKVNGFTAKENADAYAEVWKRYAETSIGVEEFSFELGTDVKTFTEVLKRYGQDYKGDKKSTALLSLIADKPKKIRREYVHQFFALAQQILAQYSTK